MTPVSCAKTVRPRVGDMFLACDGKPIPIRVRRERSALDLAVAPLSRNG